ncbi:hypothetical protein N7478_005438 [Penicillium angulare]|uniref:uncharacterized protein n=1 Tax=Penicillium angulare TaxID=116970 RepID=UPI002541C0E2|nr:uncharacterized protein N7478_005438 [Penicillium angulare]KAJ5280066.1 hypothetical protein N7478_005438 [Penicillium angulare]
MYTEYPRDHRTSGHYRLPPGDPVPHSHSHSHSHSRHHSGHGHHHGDHRYSHHREKSDHKNDDPHHNRHLLEGAVAAAGVAEVIHRHRQKDGEDVSHGFGHIARTVGAGALGAVAANEIERAHTSHERKSHHRSSSGHRHNDHHGNKHGHHH